jgi:hypothetical protein
VSCPDSTYDSLMASAVTSRGPPASIQYAPTCSGVRTGNYLLPPTDEAVDDGGGCACKGDL